MNTNKEIVGHFNNLKTVIAEIESYLNKAQTSVLDDWQPIAPFLERNKQLSEPQLRHLLNNRKTNGLNKHTRKIGRTVYISESGFLQWIKEKEP